jgi:hypothetical protein
MALDRQERRVRGQVPDSPLMPTGPNANYVGDRVAGAFHGEEVAIGVRGSCTGEQWAGATAAAGATPNAAISCFVLVLGAVFMILPFPQRCIAA